MSCHYRAINSGNGVPGIKAVPRGSAQSELEETTQHQARDAWAKREGITWWPGSEPAD
jgi:hypothetical protein